MDGVRLRGRRTSQRKPLLMRSKAHSVQGARMHKPDYSLLVIMALLLGLGAVTIYAISPGLSVGTGLGENYFSGKQLTAIMLGLTAFTVASFLKINHWKKLAVPVVVAAAIVALVVRLFSDPVNGAYRWLEVGGLSFQAAELIKLAIVLWFAGYLASVKQRGDLENPDTVKMMGIIVLVIVFVVAGLQSDLGSAAVMVAIIGFMSYIVGLPFKKLALISAGVLILLSLAIASSPYRRDRVATFINPTADCQNEGYQACQALITVGSGGMFGKGLGRSVQAYGYLPEAANDSIFAIISEKFGFLGSTTLIGLFLLLFRKLYQITIKAPSDYARLLAGGILAWLSVQMMINIGAMIGLLPLKGITLPLVSYGGTSIIFVMAALGIVFQISKYTEFSIVKATRSEEAKPRKPMSSGNTVRRREWRRA